MDRLSRKGILFIFCFIGCSSQPEVPDDRILAKVGSSIITIQDFIRRAEYTIRPAYCRQANYIHKKIVLNSLIGEKLVAMEFEKRSGKIMTDDHLETFLKGRREQAMRQIHFAEEFHSRVHLPDSDVNPAYKLAGRKVTVEFLNLPDLGIVRKIRNLVAENVTMDSIHNNLWGGPAPSREFTWFDREQNEIHQALFTNNVKKGQLLGPFKTEDDTYIVMRIKGWTDQVAVTESDRRRRWDDVKERITEQKAKKTYIKWVEDLMSGKEMNLNPDVFNAYSSRAVDFFFKMDSAKQNAMNQAIWNEPEMLDQPTFTLDGSDMDLDPNSVLLVYDGRNWTVNDFNEELRSHPFVFRKRKMNRSEFPEQLRLAIADVFRDIEITKQCYRNGYDEYWNVGTHVDMWRDASLSQKYAARIRSNNQQINDQEQWLDLMNPVIDSLQAVYSKQIKINMDAFESIELTATDMMVTQRGVPFPTVVPSFPIITTDNRLDYGLKSNLDD
jgi:hypothetical protein